MKKLTLFITFVVFFTALDACGPPPITVVKDANCGVKRILGGVTISCPDGSSATLYDGQVPCIPPAPSPEPTPSPSVEPTPSPSVNPEPTPNVEPEPTPTAEPTLPPEDDDKDKPGKKPKKSKERE